MVVIWAVGRDIMRIEWCHVLKFNVFELRKCCFGEKDVNQAVLDVVYDVEDGNNHWGRQIMYGCTHPPL